MVRHARDVIGREEDLAALDELVRCARLVTVHGVGGCGKTTLVNQYLRTADTEHHVVVPLAPVARSADVERAFAAALGLFPGPTIRPVDAVVAALSRTSGLLVVDNCEHVAEGARAVLTEILDATERWSVVTTSRVPLGLPGEHVLALGPLPVPGGTATDLDELLAVPSVQLFEERARRRSTHFAVANTNAEDVAHICRRLDGLPLAIELAAAWVPVLSVAAITEQLTSDLLAVAPSARVGVERHRTLDTCIAWSLGLVGHEQRELLRRLAVFDGPVELTTAAVLTDGEVRSLLADLVAASLVVVDGSTGRFGLLQTVRDAVRRDTSPHAEALVRADHLRAVLVLARAASGAPMPAPDAEEAATAVTWAASQGRVDDALELVGLLEDLWWRRLDGRSLLDLVLAMPGGSRRHRADALIARALVAVTSLDYEAALADGEEALDIGLRLGDAVVEARARRWLGWTLAQMDPPAAREQFDAARRVLDGGADVRALGDVICGLAALAATEGDPLEARRHLDDMGALNGLTDADSSVTYALAWSALVRLQQGQVELARDEAEEAKRRARSLGSGLYTLFGLMWSARASLSLDDLAAAHRCADEAEDLVAEGWAGLGPFVDLLRGEVALAEGDPQRAIDLLARSAPVACVASPVQGAVVLGQLAEALSGGGRIEDARRTLAEATAIIGEAHRPWARAAVALAGARIGLAASDAAEAHREALDALAYSTGIHDVVTGAAALDALAASCAGRGRVERSERFAAMAAGVRFSHGLPGGSAGPPVSLEDALAFARRGRGPRSRPSHGWPSLTPTELDVVALVAEGLTNPEIAARLHVARSTVKDHLAKVFRKLGVTTRAELAAVATRNGLTSTPS